MSAFYAGIAGALLTQTTAFVSLDVFSFERSADLLLVLVIGGTGYLYGGLIGAVVFKLLQELFQTITPQYWLFWIGLMLVVIVLVGRDAHAPLGAVGCRTCHPAVRAAARLSSPFPRAMRHDAGPGNRKRWKSSSAGSTSRATCRCRSSRARAMR